MSDGVLQVPGRVVFLTRGGRRARLREEGPKEFLYGCAELTAKGACVELVEEDDVGLSSQWPRLIEAAANRLSSLAGFHPRTLVALFRNRARFSNATHVVATNHSLGLASAFLHRLGLMAPKPILLTMGLIDLDMSSARRKWYAWLLRGALVATLSRSERVELRRILPPSIAVEDFVFGVDLDFWRPADTVEPGGYVLSIGNDPKRDFDTLIQAWRPEFPTLRIITSLEVRSSKPNIRVERGDWRTQELSDSQLREELQRAKLVIVPVRETLQPSGQSASLQAMACGRPVVMSANSGLWDRVRIEQYGACRLVAPGDISGLADAVAELLADPAAAEALGKRGRRMVVEERLSSAAMAHQIARMTGLPAS